MLVTKSSIVLALGQGTGRDLPNLSLLGEPLRVWLAHASDLMLVGVSTVLTPDIKICGQYSNLAGLLEGLAHCPDGVLLLDDQLDASPLDMIRRVGAIAPRTRIILLSRLTVGIYIDEVLHAGVHGFLYTGEPLSESLWDALRIVASGRRYLSAVASSHYVMFSMDQTQTTGREYLDSEVWQALILLMNGFDVGQTVQQMGITIDKVYRLHKRLRNWFGVSTNVDLVRQAFLFGFGVQR